MRAIGGVRLEWTEVPHEVRQAVHDELGAAVVEAVNQAGGFSPGVAARCRLANGDRVFVKAVSPDQNRQAARIHRREAEVASQLPVRVAAPRLLHVHDDGHWVVLVFEHVDGRQPHEPWTLDELDLVMPAIRELGASVTAADPARLPSAIDRHRAIFDGWRRFASGDGDPAALPRWAADRIDDLAEIEMSWERAVAGDALLHTDLRADNMLLRPDGGVVFVDWPWACRGAAFVDALLMLPSIGLGGGPSPAVVIERYGLLDAVADADFLSVFVAMCGFFSRAAQDDPPPGLPALRTFQRAQADIALAWLGSVLR